MEVRIVIRPLLVAAAFLVASSAMAQTADKGLSAPPSKQGNAAKSTSAKPAASTKRLDFVPGSAVKETSTRPAAPAANAQSPAKEGWHCDHAQASDA